MAHIDAIQELLAARANERRALDAYLKARERTDTAVDKIIGRNMTEIDVPQAAALLGVTTVAVRNMIKNGVFGNLGPHGKRERYSIPLDSVATVMAIRSKGTAGIPY